MDIFDHDMSYFCVIYFPLQYNKFSAKNLKIIPGLQV